MSTIFISYRRSDGGGYAGRLYADLRRQYGDEHEVFMDLDIEKGENFQRRLGKEIGRSDVVLAIIGSDWVATKDKKTGDRRLDDPNDYVRLEIAAALGHNIPVFPVLVGGAAMPGAQELPNELKDLTLGNATKLNNERWDLGVGELTAYIDKIIAPAKPDVDLASVYCSYFHNQISLHQKNYRSSTVGVAAALLVALLISIIIGFAIGDALTSSGPILFGLVIALYYYPAISSGRGRLSESKAIVSLIDCEQILPPDSSEQFLQANSEYIRQRIQNYVRGTDIRKKTSAHGILGTGIG